jgi:hypothetical protein
VKEHESDLLQLLAIPANVLDGFKTIIQFELSQIAGEAQKTVNTYIQQFSIAEKYAASLGFELQNYELKIAGHQQKVIEAETRNLILKTANEALEKRLAKLLDAERQLATIRSYKIFKMLSLAKEIMRKASGRTSR